MNLKKVTTLLATGLFSISMGFSADNVTVKKDNSISNGKLIFAATLIRHGDRTPYMPIKNPQYSYSWKGGNGELTPLGMRQEYKLGKHIRQLYMDKYHLLPKTYSNGTIISLAGQENRLVVSTESFLYGLYPLGTGPKLDSGLPALPGALNPIPIFTLPNAPVFDIGSGKESQVFNKLAEKEVHTQAVWKKYNDEISNKQLDKWSKIAGYKITNLSDAGGFFDDLHVRTIYNVPFPKGISMKTYDKYYPLSNWAGLYELGPKNIGDLLGSPFLGNLNKYLSSKINDQNTKLKYVVYGGHDTTIAIVMSALGDPIYKNPHYASYMNFELFKINNNYRVNITYNGKDIKIPACDNKSYCSYDKFNKLVNNALAQRNKMLSKYK
ncbi:histidine-type phosphatase [Francisella sp. LA112445]|jgi:acid phosphatase|uniref:histidine-type phosphatase n=1 Tax=Francisella sp. LA112445 TaxID=1395624 RepID=UPI001788B7DA|nr:histidine-type phosphatase [Francisella sp. LA112445]QIW10113.1 histidine phosphatase family protein [Francisella sp. LA112445]